MAFASSFWRHPPLQTLPGPYHDNGGKPTECLGTSKGRTGSTQNCTGGSSGWSAPRPRGGPSAPGGRAAALCGTTIVILGDCWGPGPFAVQVAGEAAARHDEVCAWRPVAYVLMFWLGLLTWVVLPSKTPASFNASMTQGVAVSGRCSPSTKRYTISNWRYRPRLCCAAFNLLEAEAAAQASLPRILDARVADAKPKSWQMLCQAGGYDLVPVSKILWFELNLMSEILKEHVFRIQWFYRWPVPHIVGFCFGSVWTVRTCQHILEYCLSLQGFCVAGGANLQMFAQQPSKVVLIKPG